MKNDEWWMMKVEDEGWWFQAVEGFCWWTNRQTFCDCRDAFVTEKRFSDRHTNSSFIGIDTENKNC